MRTTYPAHLVLLNLICLITFGTGPGGRAIQGVVVGRLVTGIMGSNPAGDMDVCLCVSVLCCLV
jgi:hypothetical protein